MTDSPKMLSTVIFFAVFFTVYGLLNYYVFLRGWQAIPLGAGWRAWYLVVFLFLALSFVAGRFLERAWLSHVSSLLVWVGSFWLAAMAYLFFAVVLFDLLRLANSLLHFLPLSAFDAHGSGRGWYAIVAVGCTVLVLLGGYLNALSPGIRSMSLAIEKRGGTDSTLHIVVASDIHLGTIIGNSRFKRVVRAVNRLEPDLILLPGDVVDEDLGPVIRGNLGESLRLLKARYGVLAVTGNHEYIGGAREACAYLEDHGVRVLRDTSVRLPNGVTIVGREDRSMEQFAGRRRTPLSALMAEVDTLSPVILMDHQPFGLEEAANAGVDLQLSGHTHHGQLWPFNFITRAVYEVSWGYVKKGNTHVYVSSGVGTWGPPVRTGNRPEIVSIRLEFKRAAR
ncbi:MAG: metallophosphoesterase [Bacteroidota bacterium]